MKGKSTFILLLFSILFSVSAWAQEIDVTGRVTSKDGLPIPGVSVLIQGTKNGVATNPNASGALACELNHHDLTSTPHTRRRHRTH